MSAFRGAWVVVACAIGVLAGPVTAVAQDGVELTGEVRNRSEIGDPAGGDVGGFTLLRTRLGLTAEPLSYARIFAQVQDSRVWGEEAGTLDGSADAFDLHQGYVELFWNDLAEHDLKLRLGRQAIALGNERLVGAVGWSNVGRVFDGARLDVTGPGGWWSVTGFVTTVAETDAPPAGSGNRAFRDENGDHTFGGVMADFQNYQAYVFQDLNASIPGGRDGPAPVLNIDRTTVGGRVHRQVGSLSYDFEAAYQFGDRDLPIGGQDIRAWMAGGRMNYALEEMTGPLQGLGVGLDWLSGDPDGRSVARGDYEAFDVLYHTGHRWYGFMDLFVNPARSTLNRGLVDAQLTVRTGWGEEHRVPVTATVHRFTVAEDAADLPDSDLGWELDVTAPYSLGNAGTLQAGYSVFFAGDAAQTLGLADTDETRNWFYLQLTLGF